MLDYMQSLVGIDEVGRGCWAGPLLAAAVILNEPIEGLSDSKKLTKKHRNELAQQIKATAAYGIGWVDASEIDEIGLTRATQKAMKMALKNMRIDYAIAESIYEVVIDGDYNYLAGSPNVRTMIKADSLVPAVSAASILAKVARDEYMTKIALEYPLYQFEKHVGYGTKLHHELLKLHGVSSLHRMSYKPIQALL